MALVVKNPPANVEGARDTRWLDGSTGSKHMSFSKVQGDSEGQEAGCAAAHGVTKSWT